LYPGVREGLETLTRLGYGLACVTNKPTVFTLPLLRQLGIDRFFAKVLGGDATARRKPAPDALLLAARSLEVAPARMLMVGDSVNDVGAARNAGCPVVCVPYGYNHGRDIAEARPDAVVQALSDVPALLLPVA
jgi:phosphoglycolate phosphatase